MNTIFKIPKTPETIIISAKLKEGKSGIMPILIKSITYPYVVLSIRFKIAPEVKKANAESKLADIYAERTTT